MKPQSFRFLIVLGAALCGAASADVEITAVSWLKKHLPKVSVIDARPEGFELGHIPGSQPMRWEEWTLQEPKFLNYLFGSIAKWGKVPEANEALQKRLRELGLSNNKKVVVVGTPQSFGEEGRIAWNLLYWGIQDVGLLNGGYPAWKESKGPIEKGKAKTAKPGNFEFAIDPTRLANKQLVKAMLKQKKVPLIDARTIEEFKGKKESGQKRGGHLPGAKLVEFDSLYGKDGRYVSAKKLRQLTGPIGKAKPIAYCTGGVRSALYVLLYEAYFGVKGANYAGSIWEWSADKSLPLEKPAS